MFFFVLFFYFLIFLDFLDCLDFCMIFSNVWTFQPFLDFWGFYEFTWVFVAVFFVFLQILRLKKRIYFRFLRFLESFFKF